MNNAIPALVAMSVALAYVIYNQVRWQLYMKNKIARQVDYGIANGSITIEVNGNKIEKTADLYSFICSPDYPVK